MNSLRIKSQMAVSGREVLWINGQCHNTPGEQGAAAVEAEATWFWNLRVLQKHQGAGLGQSISPNTCCWDEKCPSHVKQGGEWLLWVASESLIVLTSSGLTLAEYLWVAWVLGTTSSMGKACHLPNTCISVDTGK